MKIKNTTNFFILFGAIFFAVGMTFLFSGIIHMISFNAFKNSAETVLAEITYIDPKSAYSDSSTHTDVLVSYTVDGQKYETELNYYTTGMQVGDTIEIYVNPDNPSKIKADVIIGDVIFMIVGSIFAVIGGCFLAVNAAKAAQRKRLISDGEQLPAVITNIYMNNNVRINGRHPYRAECEYTDPFSGERYLFASDNIMDNISGIVGSTVTVYADRDDRRKYYVDIGELTERYAEELHDYR